VKLAGVDGINALLANADACAQQDNADAMVDFAKQPGVKNEQALIGNAVAYRKHPRNALNINGAVPSTLFCEKAPRNPELQGVVNVQLQGVDPGLFGSPSTGVVAFGAGKSRYPLSLSFCSPLGDQIRKMRIGLADCFPVAAGTCPFGQKADVSTCTCN
jgi:hypothetical protein